jgi:quinol monooxygenase YgiN
MRAQPGCRDEVVSLLLSGTDWLREHGCQHYVVSVSEADDDIIWVWEVWDSEEVKNASLDLPEVKAIIAKTLPMLTGEFTSQNLTVRDGLGT